MAQRTHEDERKRERKGGAVFRFLGRSGSPTIPKSIDWSTPMSALRSGWTMLAYAPQGTLLRIAIGGALGVHGLMLGASVLSGRGDAPQRGEAAFLSRVSARDAADMSLGGRKPMDALITGYQNVFGDGPTAAAGSSAGTGESGGESPEPEDSSAGDAAADAASSNEDEARRAAEEALAAAGLDAATAGGKPTKPALGALSTQIGGSGGTSANLKAGAPAPGAGGPNPARTTEAARRAADARLGGARATKNPASRRGAFKQLQFANAQSRKGLGAQSRGTAFQAASDAFEGQTSAGDSGTPIGGSGAGLGGPDGAAAPSGVSGGPVNQKDAQNKSCPPGTYLIQGECSYMQRENVTPWQSMVEKALGFFVAAAVLVVLGATLLFKAPPGPWQIAGGALIAAGVALGIIGFVIGNQIEDKYGQTLQKDAIYDEGRRAVQGELPNTRTPSQLEEASRLNQRHDFGFDDGR